MFRHSERKKENKPDKKVCFTEGNNAVKDYRDSCQPNTVRKENVVIQYQNDPEHSDAIDQIKQISMKAKSSKKIPTIIKPLNDEREENKIEKFKRENSEEKIKNKNFSTKTYTRRRTKNLEVNPDKEYFISPYYDKDTKVETVIKTDYDPAKLMFPKKEKKSFSPKNEKENLEKVYIKTDYDREKLFPKKEKISTNSNNENENKVKTYIKTDYNREKLFPKKKKISINPNNEEEDVEKVYIKTDYDREKVFKIDEPKKEEISSKRRWYNKKKEENPIPEKEIPSVKNTKIISTTIVEPAKLPQNDVEIKKTASFIRNKYLNKNQNQEILKDKNLHITLPDDMPAVIEKVYENQDPVFDWNQKHEEELRKKKSQTYVPPKKRAKVNNIKENKERKYSGNDENYIPPKKEEKIKPEPVRRVIKTEVKPEKEVKVEKEKIIEAEPEKEKNVHKNVKVFEKKKPAKDDVIEVEIVKEVEIKPKYEYVDEDKYEEVDDEGRPIKYKKEKKIDKKRESDAKPSKELKEILRELKNAKNKKEESNPEEPKREIRKREIHKEILNPETQQKEKIIETEINISEPRIRISEEGNLSDPNSNQETTSKTERKYIRPGLINKDIKVTKNITHNTVIRTQQKPENKNNTFDDINNTYSTKKKYYVVKNKNVEKYEPEDPENLGSIHKKYEKFENYNDEDDEPKISSNPIRVVNKTITETIFGPEDEIDNNNTKYNKRVVVETIEERSNPKLANDYYSNSKKLKENKYYDNVESENNNNQNKGYNKSFQKGINLDKYLRDDLAEIYKIFGDEFDDLRDFEDKFGELGRKNNPYLVKKVEIQTVKEEKMTNDMSRKNANREKTSK